VKAELNTPIYKDLPVLASWVEGFVLVCCCVS
jgi:hypothetical protein